MLSVKREDGIGVAFPELQQRYTFVWTRGRKTIWNISRVQSHLDVEDALCSLKDHHNMHDDMSFVLIACFDGWPEEIEVENDIPTD